MRKVVFVVSTVNTASVVLCLSNDLLNKGPALFVLENMSPELDLTDCASPLV